LILLSLALVANTNVTFQVAAQSLQVNKALAYLRSVYDQTVGLMSEQPYGDENGTKLFWLNDNIFVYAALKANGTQADRAQADNIRERIISYAKTLNLPIYSDGFPKLGIHEVILGYPISLPMQCFSSHVLTEPGYKLGFVIANGTPGRECIVEDFNGFADMILYQSLAELYAGNLNQSISRFREVVAMWDEHGIADSPYTNPDDPQYLRYATYKLALLLYVAQKLNETAKLSIWNQTVDTIWHMQAYNGGIITNYMDSQLPIGVVNAETTALVVLANPRIRENEHMPPTRSELPYLQILVALVLVVIALNATILIRLLRRQTVSRINDNEAQTARASSRFV